MSGIGTRATRLVAGLTAWIIFASTATANPLGGTVSQGEASITSAGNHLDIHQATDRALIDWRSFDIAPGEVTQFHQPSASSLTVNRVNAATPSQIEGALQANGNIVLINPNGIAFGRGAAIDVNGLVASTANIDEQTLNSGKLEFRTPGSPDARITNDGRITAKNAGLVSLVAPNVVNNGVIDARLGKVQLASGDTFTLDLYGDGLINLAVSDPVKKQLVSNSGLLRADGGTVSMTAAAGKNVVNGVINMDGIVQARSMGERNGKIVLYAEGSNAVKGNQAEDKGKKQGNSTVLVSGVLDASGTDDFATLPTPGTKGSKSQAAVAGERGGSIDVYGDNIALENGSRIDASGKSGGGTVRIGGDYLGQGTTPAAHRVFVGEGASVTARATEAGDGGRIIVWADDINRFFGSLDARGGDLDGNGGFVETSGKRNLDATGDVDTSARHGETGTWLLDPTDITISNAADTGTMLWTGAQFEDTTATASNLSVTTLQNRLTTNNVIVTTASGLAGNGDITVQDPISWSSNNSLTLNATRDINVNATITQTGASSRLITVSGRDTNINASLIKPTANLAGNFIDATATRDIVITYADIVVTNNQPHAGIRMVAGRDLTTIGTVLMRASEGDHGAITLHAAGGNTNGTGRINLSAGTALSQGRGLDLRSGDNAGRPDIMLTTINTLVNHSSGLVSAVVTLLGFGTITIDLPLLANSGTGRGVHGITLSASNQIIINQPLAAPQNSVNTSGYSFTAPNGVFINANIDSDRGMSFTGPVLINGDRELTAYNRGNNHQVTFSSTVNGTTAGADNLAIRFLANTGSNVSFGGIVGGSTPLGDLSVTTDNINLGANLFGHGTLTLQPLTLGTNINLNNGTTGFALQTAELNRIQNGWSDIHIGRADGTGTMTFGSATWNDPITFRSGATGTIAVNALQTGAGNSSLTFGGPTTLSAGVTTANQAISFASTVALGANTTLAAGTGDVSFDDTINGAFDLTVNAGGISLAGVAGGSTPLGAVSLLGTGSVTLFSINATSIFARADSASGDIILNGGAMLSASSAAGDSIVLAAGRNFINNAGGSPLSTAGTARWLVYSTNAWSDMTGGLTSDFTRITCTYGGSCPSFPASGNGFLYSGGLPNSGGGGGSPSLAPATVEHITPTELVPLVSVPVLPVTQIATAPTLPGPSPEVATPLPSVGELPLDQVVSQFGSNGLPAPPRNTLVTELSGNEIVLTPVASRNAASGRANSEQSDADQKAGQPFRTPCHSASPYDPACQAGSGQVTGELK
ncbi:MAG: filamentous hemagglutinin N-terminal domain-containing protein [Fimbriiglobus sp.]